MNKWFPRIGYVKPDGGADSGVTGYFLVEWKPVFSIGLLRFSKGSREAYHDHAFHAVTFWLKGSVIEEQYSGETRRYAGPSLMPKLTTRRRCHRVIGETVAWALTFRGPWRDHWHEKRPSGNVTLTHGRKIIGQPK